MSTLQGLTPTTRHQHELTIFPYFLFIKLCDSSIISLLTNFKRRKITNSNFCNDRKLFSGCDKSMHEKPKRKSCCLRFSQPQPDRAKRTETWGMIFRKRERSEYDFLTSSKLGGKLLSIEQKGEFLFRQYSRAKSFKTR